MFSLAKIIQSSESKSITKQNSKHASLYLCEKIAFPVMGDKTVFVRPGCLASILPQRPFSVLFVLLSARAKYTVQPKPSHPVYSSAKSPNIQFNQRQVTQYTVQSEPSIQVSQSQVTCYSV